MVYVGKEGKYIRKNVPSQHLLNQQSGLTTARARGRGHARWAFFDSHPTHPLSRPGGQAEVNRGRRVYRNRYSKASSFRNRGVEAPALISKIEGEIELPPALNFLDFNPQNAKFSRACGAPALVSKSAPLQVESSSKPPGGFL